MTSRLLDRLDRLSAIGAGRGANRPALSAAEQEAHDLVAGWMKDAGLAVTVDPIGNLWGRLPGLEPAMEAEVWSGSHLDTVPDGGRFDGALGVLAALDAAERLARMPDRRRTVAVVAFRDEEGHRFGAGFLGSRALLGLLPTGTLDLEDADGITVRAALAALGYGDPPPAGWLASRPAAYIEVHIEQGPELARAGTRLGVVESIAAMAGFEVVFESAGGHAGTVPMAGREDALVDAARFALALRDLASSIPGAVATIGALRLEPGASNVIPRRVAVTVDARAASDEALEALCAGIGAIADGRARQTWHEAAARMSPSISAALCEAAGGCGIGVRRLSAGAGHDAGVLAQAGIPTAMLFVRSLAGGVSHCPEEWSDPADVAAAVDVLTVALYQAARQPPST